MYTMNSILMITVSLVLAEKKKQNKTKQNKKQNKNKPKKT